jgi:hypothetical protein
VLDAVAGPLDMPDELARLVAEEEEERVKTGGKSCRTCPSLHTDLVDEQQEEMLRRTMAGKAAEGGRHWLAEMVAAEGRRNATVQEEVRIVVVEASGTDAACWRKGLRLASEVMTTG